MEFGLTQTECVELVRVALTNHKTHVSRIIAIAIRFLKAQSPGIRLIVSFADTSKEHHGGIYQAGNWTYVGTGTTDKRCRAYAKAGRVFQWRSVCAELGKHGLSRTIRDAEVLGYVPQEFYAKHRYLMPLDGTMREKITLLAKPYPKRTKGQEAGHPPALGGSTPTRALHNETAAA